MLRARAGWSKTHQPDDKEAGAQLGEARRDGRLAQALAVVCAAHPRPDGIANVANQLALRTSGRVGLVGMQAGWQRWVHDGMSAAATVMVVVMVVLCNQCVDGRGTGRRGGSSLPAQPRQRLHLLGVQPCREPLQGKRCHQMRLGRGSHQVQLAPAQQRCRLGGQRCVMAHQLQQTAPAVRRRKRDCGQT